MQPMNKAINAALRINILGTFESNKDCFGEENLIPLIAGTYIANFGACNTAPTNCYDIFSAGIIWSAARSLRTLWPDS